MTKVLLIAEHNGTEMNSATAKALSCATAIGDVDVAVLAADGQAVCEQVASLAGVATVLNVSRAENEHPLAAIFAPQIVALAANYSHVVLPSTTFGKDLAPRVAALLNAYQVSDAMEILDTHSFRRPIYAGNVIVTENTDPSGKVVITARTASFKPAAQSDSAAAIEATTTGADLPTHTRFKTVSAAVSERPDLQSAAWVVSGGRGVGSEENFKVIYDLGERLGAGVGASRAAVDAGYCPNDMQVGQTGKIIAPDIYMAFGISGAIQHITGIKDAGTIVAINKDAEAPIFEVADIGLVGDLFDIAPQIADALGK